MRLGLLSRLSGRIVITALIASTLPLLSGSPAHAGPAAPGQLSPNSTTVSGQPMLEWERVAGAAEYEVQISTVPDFGSTVYNQKTENSRATPTEALPAGDLYWRVRGVTSSQVRGAWAEASFSQEVVAGPLQLSPENGAQLQQPDDTPLLTWSPVTGATSYSIEVDNDDQFVDASTYTSKTNAFTIPDPGPQQTYYWHVRANLTGGITSAWSDDWSFDVLALPAPVLTYPDDSATTQVQDVVLDWKPVPGAVKYELRVSTDIQFTNAQTKTVVSTRYSPPTSFNNDQYWWQVRAIDVNNNKSPWATSANQFQRNWPNKPQLLYPPDNGVVSSQLFFQWDPVPHASEYQLDFGTDIAFSPNTYKSCLTNATTFTTGRVASTPCTPLAAGLYYWRVRAIDGPANPDINGLYSDIYAVNYNPSAVQQLSPANGATVDIPILTWADYPGAERYRVEVKQATGATAATVTTYSTSWTPTGTVRLNPLDGPFTWTVQALGRNTFESPLPLEGFERSFSLTGTVADDPEVAALTPLSPNGVHATRPPALEWEPWFDANPTPASYYQIFVARVGSEQYTQLSAKQPFSAGTDSTQNGLTPGDYHWYVNAYALNGTLLATGYNSQGTFTIDSLDQPSNLRLSLTGLGLSDSDTTCARVLDNPPSVCSNLQQTPVLAWDPVPSAAYYMVYLSRDRELTNLQPLSNTSTVNTAWVPVELLPDSQAGTAYYWVVRPCKSQNVCNAQPTQATNAFDKKSNPVSGLTETQHDSSEILPGTGPGGVNDFPEFADEVVLSWDDYLETNEAGNDTDVTGMGSTVEAMSYEVEMGADPNFPSADTIESGRIDQTTYTPYVSTLPEGPLYWRVRAIDGDGNALPWSEPRSVGGNSPAIEKRSPTATLVSPPSGQVVSQTPALMWDALAYAATYEVQISKNGDTTFSTANRVVTATTKQNSFVPPSTLEAAGSPYVWRVRRKDFSNRAGEWTAPRSFSVSASAPTQVSPNPDVYVSATDALFTWMPSPGAASYKFERRVLGATSAQETKPTVGLNWAPQRDLPDGKYEWRVSSYDSGNKLLASSPWSAFTVDATAPRVVRTTPVDVGHPSTSFKVDFSEKVSGVSSSTYAIYPKGSTRKISANVKVVKKKSAILDPAPRLKVGKTYTLKLLKGIKDDAGHALKPTSWTVTIRAG